MFYILKSWYSKIMVVRAVLHVCVLKINNVRSPSGPNLFIFLWMRSNNATY
jgi:hypothetical protein